MIVVGMKRTKQRREDYWELGTRSHMPRAQALITIGSNKINADGARTRNLLFRRQTRYHCATTSCDKQ
jgi:hypothetical protein